MIGVIVNTVAVLIGGTIGLLGKKVIPTAWSDYIIKGLALCVIYIGITGSLEGKNAIVLIVSMVIGTVVGVALDLDGKLNKLAKGLETKFSKEGDKTSIAQAFITTSLLFCVGAMTIVGSLRAGLTGNNEMLFTKSGLDFVSAIIFSASMGVGVLFSAGFVFVLEGGIVLLSVFVAPYMGEALIAEMTCAGSLLIIALGLNMLEITNLKVMNYLPAILMPIVFLPLYNLITG